MQLGKYTLGRELGKGGMGAVYESFHPHLARPVAIKIVQSADSDSRRRFMREAQTAATLSHPGIINIFDVDEHQGQPFLVMELLDTSLADRIARGPLPAAEVARLGMALLEALQYAHDQSIIHRDIKPANVLLRPGGAPVLADFGLARAAAGPTITATGVIAGTPAYMAPEQFRGQLADARTDLYALGVLLFEALTGRLPFDGDTGAILHGHLMVPPPDPRALNASIPSALADLVLMLLDKDPAGRPQTATQALRMLAAIQAGLAAPDAPTLTALGSSPLAAAAPAAPPAPSAATGPTIALDAEQSAVPIAQPDGPGVPRRGAWKVLGLAIGAMLLVLALAIAAQAQPKQAGSGPGGLAGLGRATAGPTQELQPLNLEQLGQAPMANAQPAANTADFSVAGVTWEDDPNSVRFFGELRNDGDAVREKIYVQITLTDAAGQKLSTKKSEIERAYLAPGAVSPFYVLFYQEEVPKQKFASYTVEVLSEPITSFTRQYHIYDGLRLEVSEVGQGSFSQHPVVRGVFHNENELAVNYPEVIAVFYNEAGEVIGLVNCYAEGSGVSKALNAGDAAPFETIFFSPTQRGATSYMLYAGGSRAQ